jgi:hypothetical protein
MGTPIDRGAVRALAENVGRARAQVVLEQYVATLDERLYMLRSALTAFNTARALVALRGLKEVSAKVGAIELAALAEATLPAVQGGNYRASRDALPQILELAAATKVAVAQVLTAPVSSGTPRRAPSR